MSGKDVLEQALKLRPDERFAVIEGILKSLDETNCSLGDMWADEAERRLIAYRAGNLEGIPMEEIFNQELGGGASRGTQQPPVKPTSKMPNERTWVKLRKR